MMGPRPINSWTSTNRNAVPPSSSFLRSGDQLQTAFATQLQVERTHRSQRPQSLFAWQPVQAWLPLLLEFEPLLLDGGGGAGTEHADSFVLPEGQLPVWSSGIVAVQLVTRVPVASDPK
jgi:hypothetical protein